jgi:hypothetical protein
MKSLKQPFKHKIMNSIPQTTLSYSPSLNPKKHINLNPTKVAFNSFKPLKIRTNHWFILNLGISSLVGWILGIPKKLGMH